MKFTLLLVILTCFNASASVKAQSITLSEKNAPLSKIIKQIEKQSGYSFFYDEELILKAQAVTVNIRNGTLQEVLDKCFEDQPLIYSIVDNTIIIKSRPKSLLQKVKDVIVSPVPVRGRITDSTGKVLPGASIKIQGKAIVAISNDDGSFSINADKGDILIVSYIGYYPNSFTISDVQVFISITLHENKSSLQEVVVSTGYQTLPKERATGSFVQLNNEIINRRVSTNILDRIDGLASGVLFNSSLAALGNLPATISPDTRISGYLIRGYSTLNGPLSPLIVVDNFPYDGEIKNINPNDVESITILKDASAASIWGARAANGVIVITTKKGRFNQKMDVEFNANVTVINKPNLKYDQNFLNSKDYIDIEKHLFDQGFFDPYLNDNFTFPTISPVVEILAKAKAGTISSSRAEAQIAVLKSNDMRDDYSNYFYQKAINQQYSLAVRGGTEKTTYALSVGRDQNRENVIGNAYERTTINSTNTFKPLKNLDITAGLNYSENKTTLNNQQNIYGSSIGIGGPYQELYPYAKLADANGNALPVVRDHASTYVDSLQKLGFLNWQYKPLDEVRNSNNSTKINDILFKIGLRYKFFQFISADVQYQHEKQVVNNYNLQSQETYFTRNLINQFAQYDPSVPTINYVIPLGSILNVGNYDWNSSNLRGSLYYNQTVKKHEITALAGAEVRELKIDGFSRLSYGYDDKIGKSNNNLDYKNYYPTNGGFGGSIPSPDGDVLGSLYRYISYYSNAAYSYDKRYTVNLSARRDGANLFGTKTNDKITPLWSAGLGWNLSNEKFYHADWLPYLKVRTTYGFNGNTYNGIPYLIGTYSVSNAYQLPYIGIFSPPNPQLRWEKVKNINLAVDFSTRGNRVSGTIELYRKDGQDLIETTPLAPQSGFTRYQGNNAGLRTDGIDATIQSQNLNGQFKWGSTLLLSAQRDKLTKFSVPPTPYNPVGIVGKPLSAIYTYKWAGLDPNTGDPQGYLNGKISKDYNAIINNFSPDSLQYMGTGTPTLFGALRNDFSYKGLSLSVNVTYKFGFVFQRPSTSLNYESVLAHPNSDYSKRWQNPGDEKTTDIPSVIYPTNSDRNYFYQRSSVLIESGSHVRLQDIRLGYELSKNVLKKTPFERLQLYAYANNLGIIWRKNNYGIDPDNYSAGILHSYPVPFSISIGLNANF